MYQKTDCSAEASLCERLWPKELNQEKANCTNPHWQDIPLANRLWPEKTWPPVKLLKMRPSPGVDYEIQRLFAEYCESGMDGWD